MMPDGDTAAHLRKQVGGLFLRASPGAGVSGQRHTSRTRASFVRAVSFDLARDRQGTNLKVGRSISAATLLGLSRISCTPVGVHTMTAAARFQTRPTGSVTHLAQKGRGIAQAHPYAVAAVATDGDRRASKGARPDVF
jgi:hypothetical protein